MQNEMASQRIPIEAERKSGEMKRGREGGRERERERDRVAAVFRAAEMTKSVQ